MSICSISLNTQKRNKTELLTKVAVVDLELLRSVFAQRAEVSDATNRWHGLWPVILKTPIRLNIDWLADLGTLNAESTTNHNFNSRYIFSAVMIQSKTQGLTVGKMTRTGHVLLQWIQMTDWLILGHLMHGQPQNHDFNSRYKVQLQSPKAKLKARQLVANCTAHQILQWWIRNPALYLQASDLRSLIFQRILQWGT